jgi:uncharacterized protein (TIRG00374 family)
MRKLIVGIALLLGIYFIFIKLAEVQTIIETLQRGDWRFVLLALVIQLIWLMNVAASFSVIYRTMGLNERFEHLLVIASAANFVNIVAPSVGVGGMAIFVSEARREGYSTARVTAAGVLFVLFEYLGFLIVLFFGLIVLVRRNNLNSAELIASSILVGIAVVMATLIYLGMRSTATLGNVLAWIGRQVNRILWPILHRDYLSEMRAYAFAHDAAEGLHEMRKKRGNIVLPVLLAFSSKCLLIFILFLMFMAFKVPLSIGTLVAGFSIGYLFLIVSPTPSGIGVVEGALTLALGSLNVPLSAAAVLTLAYRGITFWIPLFEGMLAFRWLSHEQKLTPSAHSNSKT